jgi:5-methylcytosine-specific restriction endonuclease McrA
MHIITIHKSKSTKQRHIIYGEPKSGTMADYLLLIEYYKERDIDHVMESVGWKLKLFHHFNFLITEMNDNKGNLVCAYCGKQHLLIQPVGKFVNKQIMATVDHFTPISKGGDELDHDNLVVACSKCNGTKSNKVWKLETLKYISDKKREKIHKFLVKHNLFDYL